MWDQITDPPDPAHVDAVVALALKAQPRCGTTVVVAIDGLSGSGKTTLAKGVADALRPGLSVTTVHMDDLYPGWDGLAESVVNLTRQVLTPLAEAGPAAYVRWDWSADTWGASVDVAPADVLVVEGCGSSVMPAGAYAAVRVFVEADRALRLRRGLERDGDAYRPHWERWAAQEAALFSADGTRQRADLVLDTSTV